MRPRLLDLYCCQGGASAGYVAGRAKLAAADLLSERFSRESTALWWPTPPAHTDAETMTYFRRLDLEAVDNQDEEDADGGIEAPAIRDPAPR